MIKTAILSEGGAYLLSDPIFPFGDGLCFSRVSVHVQSGPEAQRTLVLGIGEFGQEHPTPLYDEGAASGPDEALAALGYTLA